ncbi:MAG: hypothetical protein KAI72_05530 [Candidatus Pacebacteria bacterium]|nr:hypothetical protein [Candidatus Parcubacteria bacterium]MCK5591398.1 hypothetical protein [Candidatus Paceibacterota bacterium]
MTASESYKEYKYTKKHLAKMKILGREFCKEVGLDENTLEINTPIRVISDGNSKWDGKTGRVQGFVRMCDGNVDLWFENYHGDGFRKGSTVEILDSNFQKVIETLNF